MKIKVTGIVWDTFNEEENDEHIDYSFLPDHVLIDTDYDVEMNEIADMLSDEYGFCIKSIGNVEFLDETLEDFDGMICGDGSEFCVG